MSNSYGMWGRPKIVAISVTLILVSIGIYFSPAFAGGSPCEFAGFDICFDGEIDDSWVGAPVIQNNWEPDNFPIPSQFIAIGAPTDFGVPPYNVIIESPFVVNIGSLGSGSLEIFDLNTLTVLNGATLNINDGFGPVLIIQPLATLFIEGTVNNNFDIFNQGSIVCVGAGTLVDLGSITGSGTTTGCGGAAVGSISIPLDTTPMLVAGSEMNSVWITLAIVSAVGIGILIIRKN